MAAKLTSRDPRHTLVSRSTGELGYVRPSFELVTSTTLAYQVAYQTSADGVAWYEEPVPDPHLLHLIYNLER